jgi:hypothetical protein
VTASNGSGDILERDVDELAARGGEKEAKHPILAGQITIKIGQCPQLFIQNDPASFPRTETPDFRRIEDVRVVPHDCPLVARGLWFQTAIHGNQRRMRPLASPPGARHDPVVAAGQTVDCVGIDGEMSSLRLRFFECGKQPARKWTGAACRSQFGRVPTDLISYFVHLRNATVLSTGRRLHHSVNLPRSAANDGRFTEQRILANGGLELKRLIG